MTPEIQTAINTGDATLVRLYGNASQIHKDRMHQLIAAFQTSFSGEPHIYSAPGRVEIIGNHTDHNNGRVLASSVGMDILAAAAPNGTDTIRMFSKGFDGMFETDIRDLEPKDSEKNTTSSLIRGVAAFLKSKGYAIGGFDACVESSVPQGSGLSSSAAFEVLVGTILSHIFNNGVIDAVTLAIAGQYAENKFFGKPCGLMDQMASAIGGIVGIDFIDPTNPQPEPLTVDFAQSGHVPVIIKAGGSHADLTGEYAAITAEMRQAANAFGQEKLRFVSREQFMARFQELVGVIPDRAILRALHFIDENERVGLAVDALKKNAFDVFLDCVRRSGESSWMYLQNCYVQGGEQGMPVCLAAAAELLHCKGAVRLHGGGFGGTILAFVSATDVKNFIFGMDKIFGQGTAMELYIRPVGSCKVF